MPDMVGMYQSHTAHSTRNKTRSRLIKTYRKYKNNPLVATGEAIGKGYAISQIDGPLPFLDVAGVGYAIYDAGSAWIDYFKN